MGNNSRKKYSADFKAKVALEALKEQMTLPELEKKFGVSQYMISRWKNELSKNASLTFGASGNDEALKYSPLADRVGRDFVYYFFSLHSA